MKKENIKLVDNETKQPEKPEFKVTPPFDQLTPLAIKVLKNMGDIENAKQFMQWLWMDFGGDDTNLHFMMAFLDVLDKKFDAYIHSDATNRPEHPGDFLDDLKTYLFNLTYEHSRC